MGAGDDSGHELLSYLKASADDFAFDALLHGKKQVILGTLGEAAPMEVAEPLHQKTGS